MSFRERYEAAKRFVKRGDQLPPISRDYLEPHRAETTIPHDQLIASTIVTNLETKITNLTTGRNPVSPVELVQIIENVGKLDALGVTKDPRALTEIRKIGAITEISDTFNQQLEAAKAATESERVIRLVRAGVVLGYADDTSKDQEFRKLVEDHTTLIEESKKPTPEWRDAKVKLEKKWEDIATARKLPTGPRPHELIQRYTAAMDMLHQGILDPGAPFTEIELIAGLEVILPRVWADETNKFTTVDLVNNFFKRYPTSRGTTKPTRISDLTEVVKIMFVPEHLRSATTLSPDESKLVRLNIRTKFQRAAHPDVTNQNLRNFDPNLQESRDALTRHILAAADTAGSLRK